MTIRAACFRVPVCASTRAGDRVPRRAFTIVEMLVVIGIIGLLTAITLPSLSTFRREAESVGCLSNLRQLHTAWDAYRSLQKGLFPMCDFLPASTPEGPVGGLVEVLRKTVGDDCTCWYCPGDMDEEGSIAAGTSYVYLPGLLRYTPQVQIRVAALMAASVQDTSLTARQRERRRREAEAKLVGALYEQSPQKFAILTDSQDRHAIGARNPRNAVYLDGSALILRDADEVAED